MLIEPLEDDAVRVVVEGELAGPSAYTLDTELRKVEETHPRWLVIDLSALSFIDSAGLARLLAAHRRAKRDQHSSYGERCITQKFSAVARNAARAAVFSLHPSPNPY